MSNFDADLEVGIAAGTGIRGEDVEVLSPREVLLGPRQEVRRVLPNKERRMIGAWCFVDHYGPENISGRPGMRVPPHPHTGLQTVSWLLAGDVRHRDSLGSDVVIVPGQLNLMTSGRGIAHAEDSPADHSAILHGLQLWVALPDAVRNEDVRSFRQYTDLPAVTHSGLSGVVVVGTFEGVTSPATTYTQLVGVELTVTGTVEFALDPSFEYGVLAVDDGLQVDGQRLARSEIGYLGHGRVSARLHAGSTARAFLLGGVPFEEDLVMWWNFIGRTHDEIAEFRRIWNDEAAQYGFGLGPLVRQVATGYRDRHGGVDDTRFGEVMEYAGVPLPAPPMPNARLRPRGRVR